ALVSAGDDSLDDKIEDVVKVPSVEEFVSPLINVIPLQLFAYYCSVLRGNDVDQPRNLAKSVTVE
ncbi:MAG: glutamine--fructose-6-phosphate aminotransferase, partial [Endomicrobiia bacterium]|nr:glutamine--fructose-6-phosphate aminotransferase [Endomicrobiia bacterium]